MLCKYRGLEKEYREVLIFFAGESSDLLNFEPNDEAFELLDNMLGKNEWAQKAIEMLPSVPGWAPGPFGLGTRVAKFGFALFNQNVSINSSFCVPLPFKNLNKVCINYDNTSRFKVTMAAAKNVAFMTDRSELENALKNNEVTSCPE